MLHLEPVRSGATWGIDRIDSRVGLDTRYDNSGATGGRALVYILDTGIRISHSDFGGRAEAGVCVDSPRTRLAFCCPCVPRFTKLERGIYGSDQVA